MDCSKELVLKALAFEKSARIPRQLWTLPWAKIHYPDILAEIQSDYPDDIISAPMARLKPAPLMRGDKFAVGERRDEWGCVFVNMQAGIAGEVKNPLVTDEEWLDADRVHIPEENLALDTEAIRTFCKENQDKFILSACFPRPFERLQFIRGTEALLMDLLSQPAGMMDFIEKLHEHYCQELELWAQTDVDGLQIMDDWGAQRDLLINPVLWRELFKPLYQDYVKIAHRYGKKLFMHSDGNILKIIPDLIELGVDALNAQLFCMGLDALRPFGGKITFWGEMDRQHLLPSGSLEDIQEAVRASHDALYREGGCIAQCEFGPGANPQNVRETFRCWDLYR